MSFPATITPADLGGHVRVPAQDVQELYDSAVEHLEAAFQAAWRPVPEHIANECLIRVAQAIKDGRRATNAGKQLATVEGGTATRASLDPIDSIRPILARYVVPL